MKQHSSLPPSITSDPTVAVRADQSTGQLLIHLALLMLIGLVFIFINPRGYIGGAYDDGRYLAAATQWAMEGPVLGHNHWSLRWPLVLPMAAIIRQAGLDFNALLIPGTLSYLGLGIVNYVGLRSAVNARAGFLGALGILATPGITYWSCALYPDILEATLWSAAFWSLWQAAHMAQGVRQTRWVLATGFIAGLSFCVRETSAGLIIGLVLAMLFLPRLPLRLWIMAGASAAILPVAEYAILWLASGDPLYRLHVDLNHIAIDSEDMRGGVAKGQLAVFNTGIMERWAGAGPVRIHWTVDTWINFFANFYYGQNYVAVAVLGLWLFLKRHATVTLLSVRGLIPALLAIGAANTLWNLYVLALNPNDRMFFPTTVVMAMIAAILADRLWPLRGIRTFFAVLMGIKILSTLIVADTLPNYRNTAAIAQRIAPPAGPVHVSWQTHANLALADPAFRRRLTVQPVPAGGGGVLVLYANLRSPLTEHLSPGRWTLVRNEATGHYPYVIALADSLLGLAGQPPLRHADIDVRLFRHLPGPPLDHAVVAGPDGHALSPDAVPPE
ncbi:MAG TPA: glycosyltransferase family 39 protein [Sphingobium sp.]